MAWYRRLMNLVRAERTARDIEREMAFHMAERADQLIDAGMSEPEARREARRRFGPPTQLAERTRDADVLTWLESFVADLRYAARALRASPGFALVAILSLGLGIGANTAIYSLIDAVLLRSLPVHRPEELVLVTMGERGDEMTNPLWEALRDRQDVFAGVAAYSRQSFDLANGGEVRPVAGTFVSGDFFATLGVRPAEGRLLARPDDVRGCPALAVVSHGFWQSEYGGVPGSVGRTVTLDGHPFTIVGVTEPGFFGVEVGRPTQLYAPLCAEAVIRGPRSSLDVRDDWWINVIGRPKPGLGAAELRTRLGALAPSVYAAALPAHWRPQDQEDFRRGTLDALPAATGRSTLRREYRLALLVLMPVVAVVLLVACANVANLLLARAAARQREIAVRLAIGASAGRVARQLLTESLLLALLGAAVGVLLAQWGSGLLVRMLSTGADTVSLDLGLDLRVLGFTTAVAVATGVLFGLAPAWRSARVSPQAAMKAGGRGAVEGHSRFGVAKVLVVCQVALSLVLLVTAGLLLGTMRTLATLDPGFSRDSLLLVSAYVRDGRLPDEGAREAQRQMLEALRATPGVRSASASLITPLSGRGWGGMVAVDGFVPKERGDAFTFYNGVSDDFFATMGTAIVAGRDLDGRDRGGALINQGSTRVAVVNETFARRFFGTASPIGRQFREEPHGGQRPAPPLEIVGVVRDAKYASLREAERATVYVPLSQAELFGFSINFQLRSGAGGAAPSALIPAVKAAVARTDPRVSLEFTTITAQLSQSLTRERLLATLSAFFGGLALLLAAVGLYGTTAYSVARRRGEIGIRIALGAARSTVLRMVLGDVGRTVAAGVLLGALGALAATRLVATFLYGVTPTDPATLALAAFTLALAAGAAAAIPAWRAARVDPVETLREE